MLLEVERNDLLNAINTAAKATSAKSPVSALEGLLFEAKEDEVNVTGYDLKKAISTKADARVKEEGSAVLNTKMISEIARRLPDGIVTIDVNEDNNKVKIKCGDSEYNLTSLDVHDYPELPVIGIGEYIAIPQNELKEMISRTLFAVSKEELRPTYTGSLFEIKDDVLTLVSVDGYRMAVRSSKIHNAHLPDCSFIVPGFALTDIERICNDSDEPVELSVGAKHISFKIGNTVLITRRIEGDFINFRNTIPSAYRHEIAFKKNDLLSAIERVSLIQNDTNGNPVRITFDNGKINCFCMTSIGKAEDTCECEGDGQGFIIGFNDRYIAEALKAAETEDLIMKMNTDSSPCIVQSADGTGKFTYLILPVRLHS